MSNNTKTDNQVPKTESEEPKTPKVSKTLPAPQLRNCALLLDLVVHQVNKNTITHEQAIESLGSFNLFNELDDQKSFWDTYDFKEKIKIVKELWNLIKKTQTSSQKAIQKTENAAVKAKENAAAKEKEASSNPEDKKMSTAAARAKTAEKTANAKSVTAKEHAEKMLSSKNAAIVVFGDIILKSCITSNVEVIDGANSDNENSSSAEIKPESGIQSPDLNSNSNSDVEELKKIAQKFENENPGKSFIDELFGIKDLNEKIEEQIREQIGDK